MNSVSTLHNLGENDDKLVIREIFNAISINDFDKVSELLSENVELEWYRIDQGKNITITGIQENIDSIKVTAGNSETIIEVDDIYGNRSPYTVINTMKIRHWKFGQGTSLEGKSGDIPEGTEIKTFRIVWVENGKIIRWIQQMDTFNLLKALKVASLSSGDTETETNYVNILKLHGFVPKEQAVDDYVQMLNAQHA